ncbi:MAG: hypothetical protein AUI93_03865 [Crenarchaeota archaeon 13_1_40CM_3_52_10]|nr:MAG: hypothetical protein AUI93_03865 [Crenarchaeota archaeon 13_1_40CM_3_52_10]
MGKTLKETQRLKIDTSKTAFAILTVSMMGLLAASSVLPALADSTTTFSGRAFAVSVTTPLTGTVTLADTGQLPPQGGEIDATVLSVQTQQAQAEVLLSVTMGFDQHAESRAAVADVTLLPGTPNQITADFLQAHSRATCAGVSGDSEVVSLKLAGQQIIVSGQPNQTVSVPGVLTLVINEQTMSSTGGTQSITVNALDLTLPNGIEVIVSSAHSDITCGTLPPPNVTKDFMTGGGFIMVNGAHANFGFVAGLKPGQTTVSGQLNYIDHSSGNHVKSTSMTAYSGSGDCRTFSGTVDGQSVSFTVNGCDNAEPGRGADTFMIRLSNGYGASGALAGGNIQLHT